MKRFFSAMMLVMGIIAVNFEAFAQEVKPSEKSKMVYAESLDRAKELSRENGKPVFVNCYMSWAGPCQAMDEYVFSDADFAKFMDDNFNNVFLNMKSPEGKDFASKYGVSSYAYFIVLDADGNVVQVIDRGGELPGFKNDVSLALSPETSLVGTRKKIEIGGYNRDDLFNYLHALRVAGEMKEFRKLLPEYMQMLTESDYYIPENWEVLFYVRGRNTDLFRSMVKNKPLYEEKLGKEEVHRYMQAQFSNEVLHNATTTEPLDTVMRLDAELRQAAIPDSTVLMVVHEIGKFRAAKKYRELLKYMDEHGEILETEIQLRPDIERTFNFTDTEGEDREALCEYLKRASEREKGSKSRQLKQLLVSLDTRNAGGIDFVHDMTWNEILAKAKKENKLVFIDCFTSWCGPCFQMATTIFPREDVGSCFNEKFVNVKIDMEKGEGPALAQRYNVGAYPTMMFIDGDGNVVETLVGSKSAQSLIEAANRVTSK